MESCTEVPMSGAMRKTTLTTSVMSRLAGRVCESIRKPPKK